MSSRNAASRSNNPSASAHRLQLDAANKKLDDYTNLIASLSAELKQYRDNICLSCKDRVLTASLNTIHRAATSTSPYSPQDTTTSENVSQLTSLAGAPDPESPFHQSEPPSPLVSPDGSGSSTIEGSQTDSEACLHSASLSDPELPPPPASMRPAVQVVYNPEFERILDLSVVETFDFTGPVACVKFSQDGNHFAVSTHFDETHIYDVVTMSKTVLVDHGTLVIYSEAAAAPKHRLGLWTVRFSPKGKYIATGASDGQIRIWDIKHKRVRAILKGHASDASCIDFSPDGRFLASASYDHTVRIWCVRDGSGKHLSHLVGRDFNVAGNDDGHLRIWGTRTRQLLKKWAGHEHFVRSVAFQPDEQGMASGGNDCIWKSWNLSSLQSISPGHLVDDEGEKEVFTCSGHTHAVLSISISPDGRWVVTSSFDHTSGIWDATTGVWVCTLKGHTSGVQGVDFSPAGCYLVTGSYDRQVILWRYREVDGQP